MNTPTPYDDVFRTLLGDCKELILPVLNELFGETYTGKEQIIAAPNEFYLTQQDGKQDKRITDSCFVVKSDNTVVRYHLECESSPDQSIIVRIFEYDAQIALCDQEREGYELIVNFPHTALVALRSPDTLPEEMKITIRTPGGSASYSVPVMKTQKYTLQDIFDRNLFFLIPFYIFSYERKLKVCEADQRERETMLAEFVQIREHLSHCVAEKKIDQFEAQTILFGINTVTEAIARKYDTVLGGVKEIMGGRILEYEAKDILRKGIAEGEAKGRAEGEAKGRAEGRAEGEAKGRAEGEAKGRAEGEARGRAEGETLFARLTKFLLKEKRYDDLERATADPKFKEALYQEYGLKLA